MAQMGIYDSDLLGVRVRDGWVWREGSFVAESVWFPRIHNADW
jgi:hypothetical protein